jgi:hypothetical protein
MGCTQRMWGLGMGVTRGNSESGHSTPTRQQRVLTVETSGAKKGSYTERGASRVGMECRARSGVAQAPTQNPRVCRYSGADNPGACEGEPVVKDLVSWSLSFQFTKQLSRCSCQASPLGAGGRQVNVPGRDSLDFRNRSRAFQYLAPNYYSRCARLVLLCGSTPASLTCASTSTPTPPLSTPSSARAAAPARAAAQAQSAVQQYKRNTSRDCRKAAWCLRSRASRPETAVHHDAHQGRGLSG